jgi:hypothetical protein
LKSDYLAAGSNRGEETRILDQIKQLERDYEVGLKSKLEDTASIVNKTGGIHNAGHRRRFKCRKLDFFGALGDIYFEQPSLTLIESGLWCNSNERNLPYLR